MYRMIKAEKFFTDTGDDFDFFLNKIYSLHPDEVRNCNHDRLDDIIVDAMNKAEYELEDEPSADYEAWSDLVVDIIERELMN